MKTLTASLAAALCGLSLLSGAAMAAQEPQVATTEPNKAEAGTELQRWEDSFSRNPYPSMGVGTNHGLQPTWRPQPKDELADWQNGLGRDPHPGMGVGQGHTAKVR